MIELGRLSEFLTGIQVGKTGTVVILNRDGNVVASADSTAAAQQQQGRMPTLPELGGGNKLLQAVSDELGQGKIDLAGLGDTLQTQFTAKSGDAYFITFSPLRFDNWVVATVIPESDFLASIERNARILLAALAALTVLLDRKSVV